VEHGVRAARVEDLAPGPPVQGGLEGRRHPSPLAEAPVLCCKDEGHAPLEEGPLELEIRCGPAAVEDAHMRLLLREEAEGGDPISPRHEKRFRAQRGRLEGSSEGAETLGEIPDTQAREGPRTATDRLYKEGEGLLPRVDRHDGKGAAQGKIRGGAGLDHGELPRPGRVGDLGVAECQERVGAVQGFAGDEGGVPVTGHLWDDTRTRPVGRSEATSFGGRL
jgi:hypothetical protein